MNLKHESGESKIHPDSEEIIRLFLEYNQLKYENLLGRFQHRVRYHIRALPLFFHVNKNLLPGYINNSVPCTIYNYIPDAEAIDHARSFNSKFEYDYNSQKPEYSIEAIYIQDNLKSGKTILWIIYSKGLDDPSVELLKEKASYVCKWLESIKIEIEHHVVMKDNMAIAYWGNNYNSIHPDKSIFLDDFYSESILIAGKSPAWWLIPPDQEDIYEQLIHDIKTNDEEKYGDIIDFGSIANARPQDYLASAIINLINIKQCPEESWLNILGLCHKLEASPLLDCTSLRIKNKIYTGITDHIQHQDIYCQIINHITNSIYGRDNVIVISRILKTLSQKHRNSQLTLSIYERLLSGKYNIDIQNSNTNKLAYEYIPATEVIFDLVKNAFKWLTKKIESINPNIMKSGSGIETITQNLIRQTETKNGYIPVTNIKPVKTIEPYDICLQHNISTYKDNWSLFIIDYERNSYEIRHDNNPISLVAWAVFNRIIDNKTRISVICPYLSVKQTHIAEIITILLGQLPDIILSDISLETYTVSETYEKDIIIFNESKYENSNSDKLIHIYRFTVTNYGDVIFNEYDGIDGFLTFVCESLSADIKSGKKHHTVTMHNINRSLVNTFINDARNIYNKVSHFVFSLKCNHSHLIDVINDRYYAVVRNNDKLISYNDISNVYPEEYFKYTGKNVSMYFSKDIQNNNLLNYLYKNNIYGYLQVFYRIHENISHIYILDENGVLTRFSQPFHDRQSFLNQWLMFLYNTRNRIKSINKQNSSLPNIEICELTYNSYDRLIKTHLNSAMLPSDGRYFDLKVVICEDNGTQSIILKCDGMEFTSAEYGNEIFNKLKKYLEKNSRTGLNNPIYLTDVETPLSLLNIKDVNELHIRDYIKYKRNIEKRLNRIINKF